jgi:hypothetical protein
MKKMKNIFLIACIILSQQSFAQHNVIFKTGEKLEGVVMGIENDVLTFYANQKLQKIDLVDISAIFFNEHVAYDGSFDPTEKHKEVKSGKYVIKYQMKDRIMEIVPPISNATENKGRVVVDVKIDRYGIVQSVKSGAPGSTTSNEYLYIKAQFAAKGARFNETTTGPIETTGTIIIDY